MKKYHHGSFLNDNKHPDLLLKAWKNYFSGKHNKRRDMPL